MYRNEFTPVPSESTTFYIQNVSSEQVLSLFLVTHHKSRKYFFWFDIIQKPIIINATYSQYPAQEPLWWTLQCHPQTIFLLLYLKCFSLLSLFPSSTVVVFLGTRGHILSSIKQRQICRSWPQLCLSLSNLWIGLHSLFSPLTLSSLCFSSFFFLSSPPPTF